MDNYPRLLSMTFHSELQIVQLIFEGSVSSIVDSMHDVMRRGRGGSQRHSDIILEKIVCRCSLRRALC